MTFVCFSKLNCRHINQSFSEGCWDMEERDHSQKGNVWQLSHHFDKLWFFYLLFFYLLLWYANLTIFFSFRRLQNGWSKSVRELDKDVLLICHQTHILFLIFGNLSGEELEYAPLPSGPGAAADVKIRSDEAVNISWQYTWSLHLLETAPTRI